jgi:hypothetical protein
LSKQIDRLRQDGWLDIRGQVHHILSFLATEEISYQDIIVWAENQSGKVDQTLETYSPRAQTGHQGISKALRDSIYIRDNHSCQNPYCTTPENAGRSVTLTLDHKIPYSHQGADDADNLHTLCHSCNARKHARTWEAFLKLEKSSLKVNERRIAHKDY